MEKENNSQLELFSQETNNSGIKTQTLPNSILGYLRGYEKIILLIIAFILTAIVSFSLGVEKGKYISAAKTDSRFDLASQRAQQNQQIQPGKSKYNLKNTTAKQIPDQITTEKENTIEQTQNQKVLDNYTIQLASYQSKALAEREAQILRKNGLTPLILSKGKYIVLYVGNFSNKKMAESFILKLKKRYRDCLVRRRL